MYRAKSTTADNSIKLKPRLVLSQNFGLAKRMDFRLDFRLFARFLFTSTLKLDHSSDL